MNDPRKDEKVREPGAQGVIEGGRMFDEFRAKIIASLPKDLPHEEFGKQLFERISQAAEKFVCETWTNVFSVQSLWSSASLW